MPAGVLDTTVAAKKLDISVLLARAIEDNKIATNPSLLGSKQNPDNDPFVSSVWVLLVVDLRLELLGASYDILVIITTSIVLQCTVHGIHSVEARRSGRLPELPNNSFLTLAA